MLLGGAFLGNSLKAKTDVPMQIINQSAASEGSTHAPARPWYITQDDYELTLPAFEDDFTLELRELFVPSLVIKN